MSLILTIAGSPSSQLPYSPSGSKLRRRPKKPGGKRLLNVRNLSEVLLPAAHPGELAGGGLAVGLELVGLELPVAVGVDVAQVAEEVHHLVVAEQHVGTAAGRGALRLEPAQQVHQRPVVEAAVEKVAGHDEVVVAADPAQLVVDQAGRAEQPDQLVVIAVDVAHGDDPGDPLPLPDRVGLWRRGRRDRGEQQECGQGRGRHRGGKRPVGSWMAGSQVDSLLELAAYL